VPIQKSANLVEITAREKFNRRHMGDIPRIQFFAQHRYLSAFGGSGKLAIYGRALVTIVVSDILSINETEAKGGPLDFKGKAPGRSGNAIR
jgi:hypothetical protein